VGTSKKASVRLHDMLHRLPGMPAHGRAAELNSNGGTGRLQHRPLPNRRLRNRPLRSPDGHHGRPPRVLPGWQARIGRLFGQEQR
jgi:hypothetical protein